MNIDTSKVEVRNNAERKRFEIEIDGHFAVAEYMLVQDRIIFTHTEVAQVLEGNGLAAMLARQAFAYAEEHQLKIMPLCPYMAAYMKSHPAYHHLLQPGFNI